MSAVRRKRKRTRLRPKPVLWLLVVIVGLTGIWLSPITAVRHVRIESAIPVYNDRLEALAGRLEGVPCLRIDPRITESQALQIPEVETAELLRNPFGSALLRVHYRIPVARLIGSSGTVLSTEGVLYQAALPQPDLPQLQLPMGGPPTIVAECGSWQPLYLAKLAQVAPTLGLSGVIRIQMSDGGVVSLNVGSNRVILGSLENLDHKVDVLRQRLKAFPNELSENEALDLTSPDAPALKPRHGGRNR